MKARRQRQRVEVDRRRRSRSPRTAATGRAAGRRTRPSSRWRAARARGRRRAAAPGGDRPRPACPSALRSACSAASPAAASPSVPTSHSRSPGRAAAARRDVRRRRGRSRSGRARAARRSGRAMVSPPTSGRPIGLAGRGDARRGSRSSHSPSPAMRQRQQRGDRLGALGGEVAQIDRDQLPPDRRGRVVGQEMHALGDVSWVRTRSPSTRRIVGQPARRGVGGDRAAAAR